jgi:hypothetical protein
MCVKHDKMHSAMTNKIIIGMMTHESVAREAKTLGNIFVEIHKELNLDKDRTVALLGEIRETLQDLKSKGQAIFRTSCSDCIDQFMEIYEKAFPSLRKHDLDIKDIDETNKGNLKHFIAGDNDSESQSCCEDKSGSDGSVEFELDEGDINNTYGYMNDNDKRKRYKSKNYKEKTSKRIKHDQNTSHKEKSGQDDDAKSDEDEDGEEEEEEGDDEDEDEEEEGDDEDDEDEE